METLMQPQTDLTRGARVGPIVVATDGLPQSRGAIATGRALAAALGTDIRVTTVHPSLNLVVPDGQILIDPNVTASMRARLTRRVREQCKPTPLGGRADDSHAG